MLVPPRIGNGFLVEGDSYKVRKNLLLRHGTLHCFENMSGDYN